MLLKVLVPFSDVVNACGTTERDPGTKIGIIGDILYMAFC
jgi:hypothetical protein